MADLYIDQNIARPAANRLRALGHDVVTTWELGLTRASDDDHLLNAARQSRILVSHDRDYITLHHAWLNWSTAWQVQVRHSGIVIARAAIPHTLASDIDNLLGQVRPMANRLFVWDKNRALFVAH